MLHLLYYSIRSFSTMCNFSTDDKKKMFFFFLCFVQSSIQTCINTFPLDVEIFQPEGGYVPGLSARCTSSSMLPRRSRIHI